MEDVVKKIIEKLPRETAGNFEAGKDALKYFKEIKETKKTPSDFLKNIDSISDIRKVIKNKIREFLNNPEELKDFLTSLLDENKPKKEESKEATGTGGGSGAFVTKMGSQPDEYVNKVPTVREEVLKGGKSDGKTLEDIAKKHDKKGYYDVKDMVSSLQKQLNKGVKVEMEHTDNKNRAKEIAMDHLWEDPNYYDKLKKVETKEATTSASSGQYSQPAIWAKSLNKKDFKGYSKPLYKGGKFVQVKKKCKKFPYCNQGDINALKIFENEGLRKVITNISESYGLTENYIRNIIYLEMEKLNKH